MKRTLILCLCLLLSGSAINAATQTFPPLQPVKQTDSLDYNTQDSSNTDAITSLPDPFVTPNTKVANNTTENLSNNYANIGKIEQSLFGKIFANQKLSTRLSRIEKSLFTTTYPDATDTQRIDNIISNFNQINKYPNLSRNDLSKLESKFFSQNFPQTNPELRVERLEQQVFGAVQSGDLRARIEALKIVAKNYNRNKMYNNDDILDTQSAFGGMGGIGGIGSLMRGSMTGFTPPINPFNNYNSLNPYSSTSYAYNNYNLNPYGTGVNRGYGSNRGGPTSSSYYNSTSNFGMGTGVHILD